MTLKLEVSTCIMLKIESELALKLLRKLMLVDLRDKYSYENSFFSACEFLFQLFNFFYYYYYYYWYLTFSVS